VGSAKDIVVKPISAKAANDLVRRVHYSGKVVSNSSLHFGVFLNDRLEGAMSFGSPLDKRKVLPLVSETKWHGMLELNRMAFSDVLPRNSESRAMAVAFRLIRKHYPHIEWVLSFSDGTQCGDGTIYRASGFVLTQIKKSMNLIRTGGGMVIHKMTLESSPTASREELGGRSYYDITGGKYDLAKYIKAVSGEVIAGFQLRYIYFMRPEVRARLVCDVLPFSRIDEMGAGMYKGQPKRVTEANSGVQPECGGATPTRALQSSSNGGHPTQAGGHYV
jgi:hypothetical protein